MLLRIACLSALVVFSPAYAAAASVERSTFGQTPGGVTVEQYTLTNARGSTAKVITYGAIVADLKVPDREGKFASVVREMLPTPQNFQQNFPQAAAVMGRVTNRISNAKFTLDGKEIKLTANSGPHTIHGGNNNFARAIWKADAINPSVASVKLTYVSADGEEGFPGKLTTSLRYTLTDDNTLRLEYEATTDAPTPVNLTNHAYFNLSGGGDVVDHELTLNAKTYTVGIIPTGEIKAVEGTPLDFTKPAKLGARATELGNRPIYDHNFVIDRPAGNNGLVFAARVNDPKSGRTLEAWTTEIAVQLYTSRLSNLPAGQNGFFCLETQHHPDSVNQPSFPTTILRPGQTYRSTTEFRFTAK
jgi:aldose 1-epimerase